MNCEARWKLEQAGKWSVPDDEEWKIYGVKNRGIFLEKDKSVNKN